jgi:hypothetical protein
MKTSHLNPDIVGYAVLYYEIPHKGEVGITRSRIGNLDFLETALEEVTEEDALLFICHWICKGLISIP